MTYSTGSVILHDDYNIFTTGAANGSQPSTVTGTPNIGVIYGTGTGRYGYGQSLSAIAPVSPGNIITAAQWTGLLATVTAAGNHQATSLSGMPTSVTAGNVISVINTLSTNVTNVFNNVGATGAFGSPTATTISKSTAWSTSGANRYLNLTFTVNFSDPDFCRYYFNAGGTLDLTFVGGGDGVTAGQIAFNSLSVNCGTIKIGYRNTTKSGGSGTPTALFNSNNGGFWAMTTGPVAHFNQHDSGTYANSYITVQPSVSGTTGLNGGLGTVVTVLVKMYSVLTINSNITATTSTLTLTPPATTYLTNTWGTPIVTTSQSVSSS